MAEAAPTSAKVEAESDPSGREQTEEDPLRLVGTVVDGRYLVEQVVGTGGFSIVYRARHLHFDSAIVLKVLHRSLHRPEIRLRELRGERSGRS